MFKFNFICGVVSPYYTGVDTPACILATLRVSQGSSFFYCLMPFAYCLMSNASKINLV